MKLGLCDQVNCWWLYLWKSTCGCPLYSYAWRFSRNGLWCVLLCPKRKSIQMESSSSLFI